MDNNLIFFLILFFIFAWMSSSAPIIGSLLWGTIYTGAFLQMFGKMPLEYLHIYLGGGYYYLNLLFFPLVFYIIGSKWNKIRNEKIQQKKDAKADDYINCPIEILTFRSANNLFTAGNNSISFRARNNSDMAYLFKIDLWVGNEWRDSGYREFEIAPKEIKEFSILGPAWRKAGDIRISNYR